MGIFFSAGWAPCIGPILGSIMTFAANGGSISRGILLGSAYSTGLAIPFLLAALGIGWVSTILRRYSRIMRITEIVMGILLIVTGILLIMGSFNLLASYVPFFNFGL
jgi:cytochrome c-type biogenesis protein